MGAEVVRVDRIMTSDLAFHADPVCAFEPGRRSIAIDLQKKKGAETLLRLVESGDALIEGFRPGVTERLGIGPKECLARNQKLGLWAYDWLGARRTVGPGRRSRYQLYFLVGALHSVGRQGGAGYRHSTSLEIFGGGGIYLAFGIVCGLLESSKSGQGQVVDAAMDRRAASLMTIFYGLRAMGFWTDRRGENLLDSGAHFYDVYQTVRWQIRFCRFP